MTDLSTPQKDSEFEFEWGSHVNKTADDILNATGEVGRPDDARDFAKDFLLEILANGPVKNGKVKMLAERKSIKERTLRRAADDLGVDRERPEGSSIWYWKLPNRDVQK